MVGGVLLGLPLVYGVACWCSSWYGLSSWELQRAFSFLLVRMVRCVSSGRGELLYRVESLKNAVVT